MYIFSYVFRVKGCLRVWKFGARAKEREREARRATFSKSAYLFIKKIMRLRRHMWYCYMPSICMFTSTRGNSYSHKEGLERNKQLQDCCCEVSYPHRRTCLVSYTLHPAADNIDIIIIRFQIYIACARYSSFCSYLYYFRRLFNFISILLLLCISKFSRFTFKL